MPGRAVGMPIARLRSTWQFKAPSVLADCERCAHQKQPRYWKKMGAFREITDSRRSEKCSWDQTQHNSAFTKERLDNPGVHRREIRDRFFRISTWNSSWSFFATVSSKKAIILIIGSFTRQIQAQIQHSLMESNLLKGSVLCRLISFKLDGISSRAYQCFLSWCGPKQFRIIGSM